MQLFKKECDIIFKKKSTYILFGVLIVSAIILPLLSFQTNEYIFVDPSGEKVTSRGIGAIVKANELQKSLGGEVDKELINKSLKVYYESINHDDGSINWNEDFIKYRPINENLLHPLIERFKEKRISDEEATSSISENFYKLREEMQDFGFSEILSDDENQYGKKLENKVEEPYIFEPYNGWDMYIMFLSYYFKISLVIIVIFMSRVFTEAKENNSIEIINGTLHGRCKYKKVRLLTSISFSFIMSVFGLLIYLMLGHLCLNYGGLRTSVQFIQLFSPQPISIGILLLKVISFGLLGVLSVSSITAFLSYKLQKGIHVSLIMMGSFIVYIILNGLVNLPGDIAKTLFDLIPFRASDVYFILLEGVSASKVLVTRGNDKLLLFMLLVCTVVSQLRIVRKR